MSTAPTQPDSPAAHSSRGIQVAQQASREQEDFSRKVLVEIGHSQIPFWQRLIRIEVVLATTSIAVIAYIGSLFFITEDDQWLKALAALAAGTTFALSYVQWYLGRHEVSFDKFYERLNIANQYINSVGIKETQDSLDHQRNMRVFAQLDNLEYILGKRKLHFVEFDLVDRAIRTFRSECYQDWFIDEVFHWIGQTEGRQEARGYHAETRKAARYVATQVQSELAANRGRIV